MLVTKPYIKPDICFAESSEKELLSVRERIQKTEREFSSVALGICQFHDVRKTGKTEVWFPSRLQSLEFKIEFQVE